MRIKDILVRIWACFIHPYWWFKWKTMVLLTNIKGLGGNDLQMEKCTVKKSSITFSGNEHLISIKGSEVFNCIIFLRGKGHKLVIDEGVRVHNMWIKIIGNGNTIHIGSNSTFGSGHLVCGGHNISIQIGKNCMIADGVDIWSTDTHSVLQDGELINKPKPITIGDHVWIGKDVAILKGVTIGDDAVIGMRSLVTKDIRPSSLNAGSPSKELRNDINWRRNNPNNE